MISIVAECTGLKPVELLRLSRIKFLENKCLVTSEYGFTFEKGALEPRQILKNRKEMGEKSYLH